MKKYQIFLIAIVLIVVWNVITGVRFRVDLTDQKIPVKDRKDIFIRARIASAKVYSNRPVEIKKDGILIPDVKLNEKVVLYFESKCFIKKTKAVSLYFEADTSDDDEDGYPDCLVLSENDAEKFRNWFIWIGLSAIKNEPVLWNEHERDCAGLIRYCSREALKKHDGRWLERSNYSGPIFDDVEKYNYPDIPLIVDKIFRIISGKYTNPGEFSAFASARIMLENSLKFVSKDVEHALPGDIAVFFHPEDFEYPYHMMIYISDIYFLQNHRWFLYHTGPIGESAGEMRFVRYENLEKLDPSWSPREKNRYFLGFYRFKFLP
ncbi:DUF1175 domain-containing protein [Pseudothermotoga sp.]|uniref:DUF1175 domain-containing protein n=1 Tax=Pseudothermotoga sp. TaxID=2033661 RepID=UPI000E8A0755|nr:DUF1175 domain-containing protein [Pseudothermotoga sp.]HBJ81800.1 DUF1175 domain-containing protein [Pseudothermotoga sp.]